MMSSGDHDADGPALGASRVGAELRAARLRLGLALPDVVAKLRIRLRFLQAIEEGRVADLPGQVYAVGFVRSYAALLGLDAADAARRFRAEAHEGDRKTELAFPVPMPDRGVPAGAVALLGVLLMAGAYAGWYRMSGDRPVSAEVVPAVPERLAALADQDAPPSSLSPQVASIMPNPSTSALAGPMPAAPSPAVLSPAAPPPAAPPSVAFLPPVLPPSILSALAAPDPPAAPATPEARIVLRIKAEAWVQVRERQGPVLLSRIMRAGDSWPVPNGTQLLLSTGNAGGTELLVDGQATAALGSAGAVRRDVLLDPDALKAISTAQPPAQ